MSKISAYVLIVLAVAICVIGGAFLGVGIAGEQLTPAGGILGIGLLLLIIVAPLGGAGIYMLIRARQESEINEDSAELRKVLDMVQAHGEVGISDIVIELQSTTEEVKNMIYRLVGMGVFNGYVNWDEGMLYSSAAAGLTSLSACKNCGGKIRIAGKGVTQCPFCGTEYFLS